MAEITDEKIKKKHKEFNDRVEAALNIPMGGGLGVQSSPTAQRLRQFAQRLKQGKSELPRQE